ncbi:MAG: hypothetical protein BWY80_00093 [Firmicutes bacterium ADurb.Bin456]|nr:MAG: hypothetical protein BWY80_00093 [Firmicutes bacterium ADurb.Bin456]
MVLQVGDAPLHQLQVFTGVLPGQGPSSRHPGPAAVHFQCPDGGGNNRYVGHKPAQAAFNIPKFFKPDVSTESAFGDVVIEQLQGHTVSNDGGLPDGDVGEGPGMHQDRLVLHRTEQGRVDSVPHKGRHGPGHLQIRSGHGVALSITGDDDFSDSFPQIPQIGGDGKDGHQLGAYRDIKPGSHHVAIHAPADSHNYLAQALGTEINDPAYFHSSGVNIQPLQSAGGQLGIVVVAFMLHPGV